MYGRLADSPIVAWRAFVADGRSDLSAPVPCVVLQYHFGAACYRERVLETIRTEPESRL